MTLEQIENAILKLPPDEYQKLLQWFTELDNQRWDEQLEKDIADRKLEAFALIRNRTSSHPLQEQMRSPKQSHTLYMDVYMVDATLK
jgi:hypothetical protein